MLKKTPYLAVIFLIFAFYSSQTLAWVDNAKKLFEDDEYEQVIEIAKDHKKEKPRKIGLMLLAFSHLQKYELNDTKSDKKKFKAYRDMLEDVVTVTHLDDIRYFSEQADKPDVIKAAQKLLKSAFKNMEDVGDVNKLTTFVNSDNKKTRKLALDTIKRLIKVKRKFVSKGGTLRDGDIIAMQDEKLIRSLFEHAKNSKARDILILIERPALAYISDYEGKAVTKIEQKISKAILKREKKYPESSWYSGTGKVREVAQKFE